MIIQKNSKNRLAIFFFFDEEGIVDDYIIYLLNSIKHNIKHLLVVSNGQLCFEGKKKLETITDVILERENKGFDVWAYKEALVPMMKSFYLIILFLALFIPLKKCLKR